MTSENVFCIYNSSKEYWLHVQPLSEFGGGGYKWSHKLEKMAGFSVESIKIMMEENEWLNDKNIMVVPAVKHEEFIWKKITYETNFSRAYCIRQLA